MCHNACLEFGKKWVSSGEVKAKRVIEIGSCDVNGSLRRIIEPLGVSEYVGVDINAGPGVDVVCKVEDIIGRFGEASFDAVVSTEVIEHVRDWRTAISNMKRLLRPGGIMVLTTRSIGFPYHGFPYDFWRFEADDMKRIFSDFNISAIESDPVEPGIFIKAVRREPFVEADLSSVALYSVVTGDRAASIKDEDFDTLYFKWTLCKSKNRRVARLARKFNKYFGWIIGR